MRKPFHPAVEPETHHIIDRLSHVLVPPVEVGLLRQEVVE